MTHVNRNCSLPADVLCGSFVTHSFLPHGEMNDERTLKGVCGEATGTEACSLLLYLEAAKSLMLCCLALIESNCPKMQADHCRILQNVHFRFHVRRSKSTLL